MQNVFQRFEAPGRAGRTWARADSPTGGAVMATEKALAREEALAGLRAIVGDAYIETDTRARAWYARSTFPSGTKPWAVVRPDRTSQVQAIVRTAARFGLALHPISRGRNWGYGDRCALTDDQVILDLGHMNRILEVNEELGYATIEPGVSQGQMADHLEAAGLPYWTDATGAGPDASIVGNTVERGFGHTPHGDRFLHACGMDIVLADGRLLKTGFGHYPNAQAAATYKWGLGPYLDGLFTQSNLGIVTRMTFWLVPKPECFRAFFFSLRDEADIGGLVEALRPLRMRGTLRTPVHIFNDWRVLAGCQAWPSTHDGRRALTAERARAVGRRHGVEAWQGLGGLYGSPQEVAAAARAVRRALRRVKGLKRFIFIDEHRLNYMRRAVSVLNAFGLGRSLGRLYRKVRMATSLLQGRSSAECLRGALWRTRVDAAHAGGDGGADPLDHNAGFYWLSPVLPMTAAHVDRFTRLVRPVFERHGFEYQVTLSLVTGRALCAVMTVSFDRASAAEGDRARACHAALWEAVMDAGYVPYRAGNEDMARLNRGPDTFWDVVSRLKGALDPAGVIAPGRYAPGPGHARSTVR